MSTIFKIGDLILESRVDDVKKKYPEFNPEIIDYLSKHDPSGNNKYLDWLVKRFYIKKTFSPELNLIDLILNWVVYFHNNVDRINRDVINDAINSDNNTDLLNVLNHPKDINKYSWSSLRVVLDILENTPTKKQIKKDSVKLYEDSEYLVIIPTSKESSCYYGSGTKWCTAAKTGTNRFESYNKEGVLVYVINKKINQDVSDLYKFAIFASKDGGIQIYDSKDRGTRLESLITNIGEDTYEKLSHSIINYLEKFGDSYIKPILSLLYDGQSVIKYLENKNVNLLDKNVYREADVVDILGSYKSYWDYIVSRGLNPLKHISNITILISSVKEKFNIHGNADGVYKTFYLLDENKLNPFLKLSKNALLTFYNIVGIDVFLGEADKWGVNLLGGDYDTGFIIKIFIDKEEIFYNYSKLVNTPLERVIFLLGVMRNSENKEIYKDLYNRVLNDLELFIKFLDDNSIENNTSVLKYIIPVPYMNDILSEEEIKKLFNKKVKEDSEYYWLQLNDFGLSNLAVFFDGNEKKAFKFYTEKESPLKALEHFGIGQVKNILPEWDLVEYINKFVKDEEGEPIEPMDVYTEVNDWFNHFEDKNNFFEFIKRYGLEYNLTNVMLVNIFDISTGEDKNNLEEKVFLELKKEGNLRDITKEEDGYYLYVDGWCDFSDWIGDSDNAKDFFKQLFCEGGHNEWFYDVYDSFEEIWDYYIVKDEILIQEIKDFLLKRYNGTEIEITDNYDELNGIANQGDTIILTKEILKRITNETLGSIIDNSDQLDDVKRNIKSAYHNAYNDAFSDEYVNKFIKKIENLLNDNENTSEWVIKGTKKVRYCVERDEKNECIKYEHKEEPNHQLKLKVEKNILWTIITNHIKETYNLDDTITNQYFTEMVLNEMYYNIDYINLRIDDYPDSDYIKKSLHDILPDQLSF